MLRKMVFMLLMKKKSTRKSNLPGPNHRYNALDER